MPHPRTGRNPWTVRHGRSWRVPDAYCPVHAQGLMEFAAEPHGLGCWEDNLDRHFALGRDVHGKVLFGESDIMQGP